MIWQSGNRLGEMAWFPFRFLACVVPCAPTATIRSKARSKYNIVGSRNDDILYACFCTPCANCQISNELDSRLD
jgi:Cys-rich protein (TIGR01571 family)